MRDDMFCAAGYLGNSGVCHAPVGLAQPDCEGCKCYKHKWPTPAQFEKEYGRKLPLNYPVFALIHRKWINEKSKKIPFEYRWVLFTYDNALNESEGENEIAYWFQEEIVAVTPQGGKPPVDYRPDEDV